jgi:hypothetical protein
MAGNSLSGFKGAVIFQKICDAGRPEEMRRKICMLSADRVQLPVAERVTGGVQSRELGRDQI